MKTLTLMAAGHRVRCTDCGYEHTYLDAHIAAADYANHKCAKAQQ